MAIYHCSVKPVQRSAGRSSTAAAAYRAGEKLQDERTGEVHDYTRKRGVEHTEIVTPDGKPIEREALWNAAENAEKRKDGTPAREYEIALPEELTPVEQKELVREFARHLADRHGCAVDIAIHAPNPKGDERNAHAHLLCTTRRLENGQLGPKCDLEIADSDRKKKGLPGRMSELETTRRTWADLTNRALERAGHSVRVDHRSHKDRGMEQEPTVHLGPAATEMERRGIQTERGDLNRGRGDADRERATAAAELAAVEKLDAGVTDIRAEAQAWRQQQEAEKQRQEMERQQAEKARQEAEKAAKEQARQRERSRGPSMSR